MNSKFRDLPIGSAFEYRGERFTKQALSMAEAHSNRWGHIFGEEGGHEVEVISVPEVPVVQWRRRCGRTGSTAKA
jgi:hypothetical protein